MIDGVRPICKTKGCNNLAKKGYNTTKNGKNNYYYSYCNGCLGGSRGIKKGHINEYRQFLINENPHLICGKCGFKAKHKCQIDVHHIDSDNKNNNRDNLTFLCANCHRLETYNNKQLNRKSF